MVLAQYLKKRKIKDTPEPLSSEAPHKISNLIYVMHKHNATHLHYDLRLEIAGVLKSWALPKLPVFK